MSALSPHKVFFLGLMMSNKGNPENNERLHQMRSLVTQGVPNDATEEEWGTWLTAVSRGLLVLNDLWENYHHRAEPFPFHHEARAEARVMSMITDVTNTIDLASVGDISAMPNRIIVWIILRYRGEMADLELGMVEGAHIRNALLSVQDLAGVMEAVQTVEVRCSPNPGFEVPDESLEIQYPEFIAVY